MQMPPPSLPASPPRSAVTPRPLATICSMMSVVSIVLCQAGDGTHAACPAAEFDGDDDMVKLELDPWE